MAYETLPWPDFRFPVHPDGNDDDTTDFIFLTASINFAFTDFDNHVVFRTNIRRRGPLRLGRDDGVFQARLRCGDADPRREATSRASIALTSSVSSQGNIEMPMLDERVAIFRRARKRPRKRLRGRFHRFLKAGPRTTSRDARAPRVETFPSFHDESQYRGKSVWFQKRAQLLLWQLHARFRGTGLLRARRSRRAHRVRRLHRPGGA